MGTRRPWWKPDALFSRGVALLVLAEPADTDRFRNAATPAKGDQRLGACFSGVPRTRVDALREAFGIPPRFHPIDTITVGRPDGAPRDPTSRPRSVGEVTHLGRWPA